jgi:hypothetical protein
MDTRNMKYPVGDFKLREKYVETYLRDTEETLEDTPFIARNN